jgi:hypothetical protein
MSESVGLLLYPLQTRESHALRIDVHLGLDFIPIISQ